MILGGPDITSGGIFTEAVVRSLPLHRSTLTPQVCAIRLAQILSPTASIALAEGPRKAIPANGRARAAVECQAPRGARRRASLLRAQHTLLLQLPG
eukprot:scaffold577_cov405-Prasinococcus_capsulatus_cf.AAC.16